MPAPLPLSSVRCRRACLGSAFRPDINKSHQWLPTLPSRSPTRSARRSFRRRSPVRCPVLRGDDVHSAHAHSVPPAAQPVTVLTRRTPSSASARACSVTMGRRSSRVRTSSVPATVSSAPFLSYLRLPGQSKVVSMLLLCFDGPEETSGSVAPAMTRGLKT